MKKDIGICRKFLAFTLASVMILQLAACGKGEDEAQTQPQEWVWVPEYVEVEDENFYYYNTQMVGDAICYISNRWDEEAEESITSACRYSLTDGTVSSVPLVWTETENQGLNRSVFGADGSVWGTTNIWSEEAGPDAWNNYTTYLCKFDPEGRQTLFQDLTERIEESGDSYISQMAVDGQGRLYIAADAYIWLYDAEGNYVGSVTLGANSNSWIQSMGMDKSGRMYVCYYSNSEMSGGYVLSEVDFDNRKLGETYSDFSGVSGFCPGIDKDLLVYDSSRVYEYDLAAKTSEELFKWMDSDVNGSYVNGIGCLEDGRIVATVNDWENEDHSITLLTRTGADQVVQKESIVIATLSNSYSIQSSAVKYNKTSDKYRITIKEYFEYDYNDYSEESYLAAWSDALTRLNNDIISDNCPDIIDLSGLNISQLAEKGVFEDLGGYLDGSGTISRADFLENILEAFTYDGTLVSIPVTVTLQTVVGRTADVGAEMGWTLDEIIAYADAHPDAQLFDGAQKSTMMYYLMMFNENAFIDWSTGECSFDSDEFKSLLEFVNRFPDEWDYDSDVSEPSKIQNGDVLLDMAYITEFDDIQIFEEIFGGEYTFIGFPTVDGGSGCALNAAQTYAITTKSSHKDGAWEFIEQLLTEESSRYSWGFPSVRAKLDAIIEEAVRNYYVDEDGNPVLDENGEVIIRGGTSSVSYQDGWSYTYHTVTQEEVDRVMELMQEAKPLSGAGNDEVTNIISEEAEAFYKGQKTVDEVADIIQSRVKMYVSTNS